MKFLMRFKTCLRVLRAGFGSASADIFGSEFLRILAERIYFGKYKTEETQMWKENKRDRQSDRDYRHSSPGERVRRRQEENQYRLRRQCIMLGTAAAILFILLLIQRIMEKRISYGETTKGEVVTAGKNISGKTLSSSENQDNGEALTSSGSSETERTDLLILVNKDHAVPEDYIVNEHWLENRRVSVADEMYDALSAMLTAGSEEGKKFVVASGYRSAEIQQQLLDEDIAHDMREYGMTWQEAYDLESLETMPAGHSEHETGLAVDVVSFDYQVLDDRQEYTEESIWLREHCQDYGFILRYPKDKEDVTGISYEPWHFRYVGAEAAKEIMERGITLEEYLAL